MKILKPAAVLLVLCLLLVGWGQLVHETLPTRVLPGATAAPPSSTTVTLYTRLVITDAWGGSKTLKNNNGSGVVITANEAPEWNYSLNNETVTVWDASTSGYSDFSALYLEADGAVEVELSCNNGASEQLHAFVLAANVPFLLGTDDSFHTAVGGDLLAGTGDVFDLLRVKEANSNYVHLRVVLIR